MIVVMGASPQTKSKSTPNWEKATFAGGCFWCMQPPFDQLDGVIQTKVGFTGGDKRDPSYKEISSGQTNHQEAIEIIYDPDLVTYQTLVKTFWENIDPTNENGQFSDSGKQYTTVIFYHNKDQKITAEQSKKDLQGSKRFSRPIVTEIKPAKPFYAAENNHQKYYQKNPKRYKLYKYGSGRGHFLERFWGK